MQNLTRNIPPLNSIYLASLPGSLAALRLPHPDQVHLRALPEQSLSSPALEDAGLLRQRLLEQQGQQRQQALQLASAALQQQVFDEAYVSTKSVPTFAFLTECLEHRKWRYEGSDIAEVAKRLKRIVVNDNLDDGPDAVE